jgi:hypothetical protein
VDELSVLSVIIVPPLAKGTELFAPALIAICLGIFGFLILRRAGMPATRAKLFVPVLFCLLAALVLLLLRVSGA